MTLAITHAFISSKSDGADPTNVQPSNWNDRHVIVQMPGTILGAVAGGAGQTIELPISVGSDGYTVVDTTTAVRLAVGTAGQRPVTPAVGDLRFNSSSGAYEYFNGTLWVTISAAIATGVRAGFTGKKTSCPAGWVVADGGTIGDAASNASNRKDPDTQNLFTLLFNDFADTELAMKTSGGVIVPRATYANAAAAFAAHSQMATPNYTDVFVLGVGGANAPVPGKTGGSLSVSLALANLPPHVHTAPASVHTTNNNQGGGGLPNYDAPGPTSDGTDHGLTDPPAPITLPVNPFIGEVAIIKL